MGQRLGEHVDREERGVFAAAQSQDEFVEAVLKLESEHVDFDARLDLLDIEGPDFDERVTGLLRSLSQHVDQENLGIFPVASVTLGAAEVGHGRGGSRTAGHRARDGAAGRSGLDTAGRTTGGDQRP